jgi:hypothetical protein
VKCSKCGEEGHAFNSCRYSPEVAARKRLAVKAGGYLASVGGHR